MSFLTNFVQVYYCFDFGNFLYLEKYFGKRTMYVAKKKLIYTRDELELLAKGQRKLKEKECQILKKELVIWI